MENRQTPGLAAVFVELITYVFFLKRVCARTQPEYSAVKGKIDGLVDQTAKAMRAQAIDPRDYDDARFAVVAWIDETLLNIPWAHRELWKKSLLQVSYYNTTNAGEEFFERLNRLRPDEKAIREVYYLCLSLGFRGRYHLEGDEFLLDQLRKSNLKSMLGATKELSHYAKEPMFPAAYATQIAGGPLKRRIRFWSLPRIALAVIPPLLVAALFFVYNFVLNGVIENFAAHVQGG